MNATLLEARDVTRRFKGKGQIVQAVAGVSLTMAERDLVCVVGESGSGKTTFGRLLADLDRPTTGSVVYRGRDIRTLRRAERLRYRLGVQLIHQDPYASLNPSQTIG